MFLFEFGAFPTGAEFYEIKNKISDNVSFVIKYGHLIF